MCVCVCVCVCVSVSFSPCMYVFMYVYFQCISSPIDRHTSLKSKSVKPEHKQRIFHQSSPFIFNTSSYFLRQVLSATPFSVTFKNFYCVRLYHWDLPTHTYIHTYIHTYTYIHILASFPFAVS